MENEETIQVSGSYSDGQPITGCHREGEVMRALEGTEATGLDAKGK